MNREQAREYIKQNIPCTDYLEPAPNHRGNHGYCCPYCGSGTHGNKSTGAVNYYADTNTWCCFACSKDKSRDVIDAYRAATGSDYNTALSFLAERIGITIDSGTTAAQDFTDNRTERPQSDESRQKDKSPDEPEKIAQNVDFSEYYKKCSERINDPEAISYLKARGISAELASLFNIGFDPAADPASAPGAMGNEYKPHPEPRVIIPCTNDFYIARSINPNTPAAYKAPNPKGTHTQIFNTAALYNGADVVFVCEGWADAASFLEAGYEAIATNGKGNGNLLLEQLNKRPTAAAFIIVPDNDENPNTAATTMQQATALRDSLRERKLQSIVYNVAGEYHDANDALIANRTAFEEGIAAAKRKLQEAYLPTGTLTFERAVEVFETANDKHIEMAKFPNFCKLAKIKLHDSVVIAADTGAGKSSLAINFIDNLNDEYPVIYFNLEMDTITILRRLVSIRTGMELDHIEGYQHDKTTAAAVNTALKEITSRKPLQIIQNKYSLKAIETEIRQAIAGRTDPTIVVIDHSLLVTTDEKYSRYERFTHISEELRRISRLNNVILFVLLQQNRDGKADENKRPTNSSLKESGSWENDATHIVFLWYDPKDRTKKLLLTKNRAGSIGDVNLSYNSKTQFYYEAKMQPNNNGGKQPAEKKSKRDQKRERLQEMYAKAYSATNGKVTFYDLAEAGDVSVQTVKGWVKEYGGYTVEGKQYDPAGIDVNVEQAEYIHLTPQDDVPPFDDDKPQTTMRI